LEQYSYSIKKISMEESKMEIDEAGSGSTTPAGGKVAMGGGSGGASGGLRFEVKKWSAVAMWSWDICADTCAICRNSLNEPSIEYQVLMLPQLGVVV
jgi:RING-box protein 1